MKNVLLISMPFCTTKWPAVGISLLKSELGDAGVGCDIKYLNIVFAEMVGLDIYEQICLYPPQMIGERLFAGEYFSHQLPGEEEYRGFLKKAYSGPREYLDQILSTKKFIRSFLDYCIESITWESYDIVGFTTMFEQNMASLSLAREIKQRYSDKIIVFGGANCEGEMGHELHRSFPFIDYVCSGESDLSFPELVKRISQQKPVKDIGGIIYRRNGDSVATEENWAVNDLDALPYPDYDDYFKQIELSPFPISICDELHMETSRGCWWGAKSQCNFCGLNGHSISFRSKSKDRVMREVYYLLEKYIHKYGVEIVSMVDNVLDMKYFKELFPELREKKLPVNFFYEVKANLTKEQVRMLHEAGVAWIQPGIESLNTHMLKLMGKGISGLQNIKLLKFCKQFDVYPTWNIIYGFPGEKEEDYINTLEVIQKITHLVPPEAITPLSLQRFSPYFKNPEQYGLIRVRQEESYRFIYPFKKSSVANLAYFFDFDYRDEVRPPDYHKQLSTAVDQWRSCYESNENLYITEKSPDSILIRDTRSCAVSPEIVLDTDQKDVYEYCDTISSFSSIFKYIREKYTDHPLRERDVRDFLEEMVALDLMVSEGDRYLSLAIPHEEMYTQGRH